MFKIEDLNLKITKNIFFLKVKPDDSEINENSEFMLPENNTLEDFLMDLCDEFDSLKIIAVAVLLDNTVTVCIPTSNDVQNQPRNFNVISIEKKDLKNIFPNIVDDEKVTGIALLEQVDDRKFISIAPVVDDSKEIDYDKLIESINYIFKGSDELGKGLNRYFAQSIENGDLIFMCHLGYLMNFAGFNHLEESDFILFVLLDELKKNNITEDQFIYYLVDAPDNIINKITNLYLKCYKNIFQ